MATHSSVLAWRIPGTGEPGGLPSMGSHRVRHDWSDLAAAAATAIAIFRQKIHKSYVYSLIFLQIECIGTSRTSAVPQKAPCPFPAVSPPPNGNYYLAFQPQRLVLPVFELGMYGLTRGTNCLGSGFFHLTFRSSDLSVFLYVHPHYCIECCCPTVPQCNHSIVESI